MMLASVIPILLSALLLAAHFSRADNLALVVLSFAFPLILLIRRNWAARAVQVILLLGALEWLRTLLVLVQRRQNADEPWVRLAVILGAVVLFTALSTLVFRQQALKKRYSL